MFVSNDTQSSTLQISNLDLQDSGNYSCTVQSPLNVMKQNERIIILKLNGKLLKNATHNEVAIQVE